MSPAKSARHGELRARDGGSASPAESDPLGVYVHFPYCLRKCPYCDFLSVAADPSALPHREYADAVIAELGRRSDELRGRPLASVFFGGGTPSLWAPEELGRVLEAIRAAFHAAPGAAEVTAECNPTSFDGERARALLDAGVNRVSLGVQSLDETRLKFLGRLHDAAGGLRAVRDALEAGVPRVSADLIFGVAGQSAEDAAREARTLAELGPTHLSAYALTIEEGTEFGALARRGKLPLLKDDVVAESFAAVEQALGGAGFEHYEISNYARAGHVAEHNLGYWRGRDYLGLGCGAWGTVTLGGRRVRYKNTAAPVRYLSERARWTDTTLDRVGPLVATVEAIDAETALRERILLGLRLDGGLDLDAAAAETGAPAWTAERERAAAELVRRAKLAREGPRLWIPRDQWLLADGIIAQLM